MDTGQYHCLIAAGIYPATGAGSSEFCQEQGRRFPRK
jgi:hypothetical protein